MADDVGSLLLRAGLVAPEQLAEARQEVKNVGGTVPEQLVQQGYIADEELTAFYRKRLLIPRINPSELAKLSNRLLEKVPSDMATEFRSIPVSLDGEGNLTLVMSDPSDTQAVDEIGFFTGNYVVRAIATQAQIAWCLAHYYKKKTKLYLGLVADGHWPDVQAVEPANSKLATIEMPRLGSSDDRETGPMSIRKPKKLGRPNPNKNGRVAGRTQTEDDPDLSTRPSKVVAQRPSNQQPSPPELFARAGEIRSAEAEGDHAVNDDGPAVVISLSPESGGVVQTVNNTPDTAPILLTDIRRKNRDSSGDEAPIVLDMAKRKKRRSSKRTNVGIGQIGSDQRPRTGELAAASGTARTAAVPEQPTAEEQAAKADTTDKKSKKSRKEQNAERAGVIGSLSARSVDLVGGDWGAPGTTIPPGYLGAISDAYDDVESAIPVAIDDDADSTSQIRAPNFAVPANVDPAVDHTVPSTVSGPGNTASGADATSSLLLAVRKIDRAENRGTIVEGILNFLDLAYERSGFMAVRQDDLVSWRLHGTPDGASSTICIAKDSTFKDVVRTRLPYNGPLEDPVTKKLAGDLDIPDALDLLVIPITLRERVIGVFFALSSYGPINEEHIAVLTQAASEAFERIVLASKK